MPLHHLPVELIDGICQDVSPRDLANLSQTSAFMCPIAQRHLYRHVHISPSSNNLSIVFTLARRPQIALFVRSFSVRVGQGSQICQSFYPALADVIAHMSGLVSLDIDIDSEASWVLTHCPRPCAYPYMLRFTTSFRFDSNVAAFLAATPALLELGLDPVPDSIPYPIPILRPSTIPHLIQFFGSTRAAKAIIPGRPIEAVHLHNGDLTEDVVISLAHSTASVVALDAATRYLPIVLLELLARHLPALAFCRIATTQPFTKAPDIVSVLSAASLHNIHMGLRHPSGFLPGDCQVSGQIPGYYGIRTLRHALGCTVQEGRRKSAILPPGTAPQRDRQSKHRF
jgi:hypothetical protein